MEKKIQKEFFEMKETLGKEKYDLLNIISGTLLSDAIVFMKKMGVLEEFLGDKNEISNLLITKILKNRGIKP